MMKIRHTSVEERQEIADCITEWMGEDEGKILESLEGTPIPVLDGYMSDGPGYFGPIFFVVFGGGPEFHLVLTKFKDEKMQITKTEFPHHEVEYHDSENLQDPVMKHIMNDEQLTHDPGCTGDPERCDCNPDDYKTHETDEDCQGWIKDGCCIVCGAGHGDPCEECSGKAYHKKGCSHSDASFEEEVDVTGYYID